MPVPASGEVPNRYPVSVAGRAYMTSGEPGLYKRESIPLQRPQQDNSAVQGEQSLNPEELWRKSFESWHKGSGQTVFDRPDSDPFRFRDSLGVDPWTKYQLSLLGETERKLASTNTTVKLAVAGSYLYCADGQTLKYTQDVTGSGVATWTTVTGTPGAAITDLASDGYNLWVGYGDSGIYKTTRGVGSASQYHALKIDGLAFTKGRLMVAQDSSIYNVTGPAAQVVNPGKSTDNPGSPPNLVLSTTDGATTYPVVVGELLVAAIAWESTTATVGTPAGWTHLKTQVSADRTIAVFYKVITAFATTESVTFTFSAAVDSHGALTRYENVDTSTPIATSSSAAQTASSVARAPSVQAERDGSMFVIAATTSATASFSPFTAPEGYTLRENAVSTGTHSIGIADKATNTGASGEVGFPTIESAVPVSGNTAAILFVVNPNTSTATLEIDALFTHPNSDFTWVGFAEGQGDIYAAGYSGDKSLVYKTQIRADGTSLASPVVAGSLPDGEIVRSIYGYLGFVFLGTDKGVRMCASDANGDLTIGPLIQTPAPVRCFEGQDRFVWYGLENFDVSDWASGTYDGLGRLDLSTFTSTLAPAYASDLMVTTSTGSTDTVQSVATFQNVRVLAIGDSAAASRGVYAEKATKVATGYIDTGTITYGISDTKVATYLDLRHNALPSGATVVARLSANGGTMSTIGTSSTALSTKPSAAFNAGPARGETHEVRLHLTRASSADTAGPVVTRATLRSEPAPLRGKVIQVPILLFERQVDLLGSEFYMDVAAELALLEGLFATQTLVTYQEMNESYSGFVRDVRFVAERRTSDNKFHQGVCLLTVKVPGA